MPAKPNKPTRKEKLAHLDAAIKYVRGYRTALDVGAHVGYWSQVMAPLFERVYAFEPVAENVVAWLKNMEGWPNAVVYRAAIGNKPGTCRMEGDKHSKRYAVWGEGKTPVHILDDTDFGHVDLLKIDCEGADFLVLQGAKNLIHSYHPVIIVERLEKFEQRYGVHPDAIHAFLTGRGYELKEKHWCDYIYA